MRLDGLAKQQTQDHRREKSDGDIESKALRLFFSGQCQHGSANFLPVNQNHRKNGTRLNGNVKHLGLVIVKAQQGPGQNQMPGT
ncbi:hypothetical protein GALL_475050 [mine drainage metagenome]|uniref:Uncharacterized protein n=1 Tax=mine drainage metagenome TaxID=410659 RepID=A0A1J5PH00_9ZZZZ